MQQRIEALKKENEKMVQEAASVEQQRDDDLAKTREEVRELRLNLTTKQDEITRL